MKSLHCCCTSGEASWLWTNEALKIVLAVQDADEIAIAGLAVCALAFLRAGGRAPNNALKIANPTRMMTPAMRELLAPACLARSRRNFIKGVRRSGSDRQNSFWRVVPHLVNPFRNEITKCRRITSYMCSMRLSDLRVIPDRNSANRSY